MEIHFAGGILKSGTQAHNSAKKTRSLERDEVSLKKSIVYIPVIALMSLTMGTCSGACHEGAGLSFSRCLV